MPSEVIVTLPDPLVREARAEGLLDPAAMEQMIKRELARKASQRLSAVRNLPGAALDEAEIQTEVDIVRAAKRPG